MDIKKDPTYRWYLTVRAVAWVPPPGLLHHELIKGIQFMAKLHLVNPLLLSILQCHIGSRANPGGLHSLGLIKGSLEIGRT